MTTSIRSTSSNLLPPTNDWDFDRIADDQIAMAVEGQWRTYSLTLAWCGHDETLRLIATFEMEPPKDRMAAVYELLNTINDASWTERLPIGPNSA